MDALSQLASAGLVVESLEFGRLVRCRSDGDRGTKRSGWYVAHELRLDDGRTVVVGRYGDWRRFGDESFAFEVKSEGLSAAERQRLADERERVRKQAEAEKAERERSAAQRAARIFPKLPESGASPYLARKKVRAFGLRFSRGSIVVPVNRWSPEKLFFELVGLQFIAPDGEKKFLTGTPKRGAMHLIGFPAPLGVSPPRIFVAEGYATAATVHMAMDAPVVVAFDAGNLMPVCKVLRGLWPDAELVICADNDSQSTPCWGCTSCAWMSFKYLKGLPNPAYQEPADCPRCGRACKAGGPGEIHAHAAASAVSGRCVMPDFIAPERAA